MTIPQLVAWRKRRKLTQGALADLLRVDVSTVARWEQGRRKVPHWLAASLAALTTTKKKKVVKA